MDPGGNRCGGGSAGGAKLVIFNICFAIFPILVSAPGAEQPRISNGTTRQLPHKIMFDMALFFKIIILFYFIQMPDIKQNKTL